MLKTLPNDCYGCQACFNICPVKAITMREDGEGFLYPRVDDNKCLECNLCNRVCPAYDTICRKEGNRISPRCIAGWNKDEHIRKESSSGGVFSLLAQYVFGHNGYVCGAAFNEQKELGHIIIAEEKDLFLLRGSKYLQSNIGNIFSQIREKLEQDKLVLFSGTPCQVAGLYRFLGKDHDHLLTVDVLCHGVPSPMVFGRYLGEIAGSKDQVTKLSFRDKSRGWKDYCFSFSYQKEKDLVRFEEKGQTNLYIRGFIENLYLRPCCATCHYAKVSRISDVTLGDFWGIDSYDKKLDNDKGTSLILLNSVKGEKVFKEIRHGMQVSTTVPLKIAFKRNPILKIPSSAHQNRKSFFEKIKSGSVLCTKLIADALGDNNVGIMNLHHTDNFGAVLVAYALLEVTKKLGFQACIINYIPAQNEIGNKDPVFEDFRNQFLKMTIPCRSERDLRGLNDHFSKFIAGSDQVWRWHSNYKYMFYWVTGDKTMISYAASFGVDAYDRSRAEQNESQRLISRFDAVSVREKTGLAICQDIFNKRAEQVLDPTLLLDESGYQEILNSETPAKIEKQYIAYMLLDEGQMETIRNEKMLPDLKKDYEFINILKDRNGNHHTVSQWLQYIKNASYIITDSYHCCIFSILFKKQFVCIKRDFAGNNRIESLFEILGVDRNRFYNDLDDISEQRLRDPLDYESAYVELEKERQKSLHFLKKYLSIEPSRKKYYPGEEVFIRLFNILPLLKLKRKRRKTKVLLFGFIPLLNMKHTKGRCPL